ncbi:MAG: hypothetical protein ACRBN8_42555 [Nannocystales bacterium]
MAHSHSWIDLDTLRALVKDTAYRPLAGDELPGAMTDRSALLETSSPPRPPERSAPAEPTLDRTPTPSRPVGSVRRATRPTLPNPDLGPPGSPPPVRASMLDPFLPTPGRLESRLEQLMVWACKVTGLARAYVADSDGLLVASLNAGANAVDDAAAAVDLCSRSVPADIGGADAGSITMVASERTHVIAWDLTRHGRTYLALSGTVEPTSEALSTLSRALRDALR